MDEAYTVVDLTLSEAKMHDVPRPGRLSSGRGLGPGRWSIEVRDVYVLPFDIKQTELAVWTFLSQGAIEHVRYDRKCALAVRVPEALTH